GRGYKDRRLLVGLSYRGKIITAQFRTFATISAITRREQVQQTKQPYSITSSVRASSGGEISMPITLAVCKLMTNSNLVARSTGRSAGVPPLRMRTSSRAMQPKTNGDGAVFRSRRRGGQRP